MVGLGLSLFILCMIIGVPIFAVMALSSFFLGAFAFHIPLSAVVNQMVSFINSHVLIAILLYIYLGYLMEATGAGAYLVEMVESFLRQFPGGLCLVVVAGNAIFGALCGSMLGAIAALGPVLLPKMQEAGYPRHLSATLLGVSSILSILIPPSVLLIVYSGISEVPTGHLFAAGMLPGLVAALLLYLTAITIPSLRRRMPPATWDQRKKSLIKGLPVTGTAVVILGTIWAGVLSPNEAAVAGIVYIILIDLVFYHNLTLRKFLAATRGAALMGAAIYILLAGTGAIATLLHYTGVPKVIAAWALSATGVIGFLLMCAGSALVLGMMMDAIPTIVIVTALLLGSVQILNLDVIQWGVFISLIGAIGTFTPPVCSGLYTAAKIANLPPTRMIGPTYYLLIPILITAGFIALFPDLSLIMVRLIYG